MEPQWEESWREIAACLEYDPEIFFSYRVSEIEMARSCCNGCPVNQECLESGISSQSRYGTWGGQIAHLGELKKER